jgi:NtrC-family two-component system sensor histidine kinase KinB
MTLKKKLSLGLGFLFLIIFVLAIVCSYNVGKLSQDAENILKDNYNSLVFSKNMIAALEDTRTAVTSIVFNPAEDQKTSEYYLKLFEAGRAEFESHLKSENGNITEIHEREYVATVNQGYVLYANLCLRMVRGEGSRALYFNEYQPAFEKLTHAINNINDLNMQAVERKSQMAKDDSVKFIRTMALVGVFCLLLAFGYFWYFPFYISNTIAYLAERMKTLLGKSDIVLDIKTNDEAFVILQGINLLENRLEMKGDQETPKSKS